ncbi:MAG TPA: hypothetical protein VFA81_07420 [Burkholderiales bacterium]|nr:hypothetical protein [Burkholderiales bacterium]
MTQTQHHEIKYFVNGEDETSSKPALTVKEILENAGFTPATDYTLASENPPKDFDSRYDEFVEIHSNERFQAKFKGPTPTS